MLNEEKHYQETSGTIEALGSLYQLLALEQEAGVGQVHGATPAGEPFMHLNDTCVYVESRAMLGWNHLGKESSEDSLATQLVMKNNWFDRHNLAKNKLVIMLKYWFFRAINVFYSPGSSTSHKGTRVKLHNFADQLFSNGLHELKSTKLGPFNYFKKVTRSYHDPEKMSGAIQLEAETDELVLDIQLNIKIQLNFKTNILYSLLYSSKKFMVSLSNQVSRVENSIDLPCISDFDGGCLEKLHHQAEKVAVSPLGWYDITLLQWEHFSNIKNDAIGYQDPQEITGWMKIYSKENHVNSNITAASQEIISLVNRDLNASLTISPIVINNSSMGSQNHRNLANHNVFPLRQLLEDLQNPKLFNNLRVILRDHIFIFRAILTTFKYEVHTFVSILARGRYKQEVLDSLKD